MRSVKLIAMCIVVLACKSCMLGCGGPLYPERSFTLNPKTGQVTFSSTQEEDLIIGGFTASDNPDTGMRSITLGSTSQPAVIYGSKSVGAMEVYVKQQEQYRLILEVVGDDVTNDLQAIGGWISSIAGTMRGGGLPESAISAAVAPLEKLKSSLATTKALIDSCPK